MSRKLFTMKDIARIFDSISAEEAQEFPVATRYVKDIVLLHYWPGVIQDFYPNGYTMQNALHECHLADWWEYRQAREDFRQKWIDMTIEIIRVAIGDIPLDENIKQFLIDMAEQWMQANL